MRRSSGSIYSAFPVRKKRPPGGIRQAAERDFANLLTVSPRPNDAIGANDGSTHIVDSSSDDDGANTMVGRIRSNMGPRNHNNRCRSSTDPQSQQKCQRRGPLPAAERKQPILGRPTGVIGTSSYYSLPLFFLCRVAGSLPIKRVLVYRPESDLSGRNERCSSSPMLDEPASCRIRLIGQNPMHNAMASAFEDAVRGRLVFRSL